MLNKLLFPVFAATLWLGGTTGGTGPVVYAQGRTPSTILELPIKAQYCAILRALTSRADPRCPDIAPYQSGTRGLVITDAAGQPQSAQTNLPQIATAIGQNFPATRSFSPTAVPATGNPGEAGYFIHFAFDSANLGADYKAHLSRLADVLKTDIMAASCVHIVGHTDTVGTADYNLTLSQQRAQSVQDYLVSVLGLPEIRVGSEGRGETAPLLDVPGGHPMNRRVEILSRDLALGCR